MSERAAAAEYAVGTELSGPVRVVTAERIEWYDSAMLSAAKGALAQVGDNIHTDDAFARNQGLPGTIADGMLSTNWCSSMLIAHFGMDYVERGELRTKFIKPIFIGATVSVKGRILSAEKTHDGATEYRLEVWCETEDGTKVVDGDARVVVSAR
ncbi:MAG: MaoC family dehydratase [Geminicoccaceae bacterium]